MADHTQGSDNPFGNFSIQDTMEMGMGNTKLVEDFLETGSATATPTEISLITKETTKKEEKKAPVAKKPEASKKPEKKEEEDDTDYFSEFLNKSGEEKNEEEEVETPVDEGEVEEESTEEDEKGEKDKKSKIFNPFNSFSKELFKMGAFSKEEGEEDVEITTPEEFLERFTEEKKKGANEMIENFIGQFGEDYQDAFQAIFVKGVNPKDYYSTYNNIQNFAEMDLSQETSQIAIIKQGLLDQGMEPEDVAQEVERIKNHGDMEPVAQRFHKVLVKKEASKLQQLEEQKEQRLQQDYMFKQQYSKNVTNVLQTKLKDKEFDGIPINPKLASEIQDFLITDKYKTPTGEKLTDFDKTILDLKLPQNHEKKVKLALLMKYLEKDPTLSVLKKASISKKSNVLFEDIIKEHSKMASKQEKQKPSRWEL